MEKNVKGSWKTILLLAGAYVSLGIGAGFGSGTDLMQFYAPHGLAGSLGIIMAAALTIFCIAVVSYDCRKYGLTDMNTMFRYYCGPYVGPVIKWFSVLCFFLTVGSMIAGAAASMQRTFGLDVNIGTVIMLVVVIATTILGMEKLTAILGNIAPIILIAVFVICVNGYLSPTDTIKAGDLILKETCAEYKISGSLIFTGFLGFTYVVLNVCSYSASISSRSESVKELVYGNVLGHVIMVSCQFFILFAFIFNASAVGGADVPLLVLASRLGRAFSVFYGVVLILATYTTATGIGWVVASNIQPESSKWYKAVVVGVYVGAYVFSRFGTFGFLMNITMKVASYVGVGFAICMVAAKIYRIVKKDPESAE